VGWIQQLPWCSVTKLYRKFFLHGYLSLIQDGVEFIDASSIEIGDGVHIFSGVRLDGRGLIGKICIGDQVSSSAWRYRAVDNGCIEIGERTFIGPYTCIAGPGSVKIGKDCLIAAHTGIVSNNHNFADPAQKIRDQLPKREF